MIDYSLKVIHEKIHANLRTPLYVGLIFLSYKRFALLTKKPKELLLNK